MAGHNFISPFTHSSCLSSPCNLVTTTVDLVEEPLWLFELLKNVCTSLKIVVICNSKVIQPAGSNPPIIFDLDVAEFVRSYCLPCGSKSVEHLSSLQTIRPAPQDPNQHELSALKSSLRSGWQSGHVVICSTDGTLLLDGATRVFLLSGFLCQGVSGTCELPVVQCLQHTPAWIINAIIVLLSQSDDRRTWSPSDTLNLASFQIESLRNCPQEVKQTAISRLRKEKVFNGLDEFIDIASVVQSRELCSVIGRNLVMKKGSVHFFKNLTTKTFLEHCKRVSAGSVFTGKPCQELISKFVSNLQSQAVSVVLHEMFKGCQHGSILYGILVEHTHAVGTVSRLVLKWNLDKMRHESKSHYVCASQQYNRFEFRDCNQNRLIASKLVASLVPELGCMQGTASTPAAWLCEFPGHSVKITELDSDSNAEEESVTVCDREQTVSHPKKDSRASASSQKLNISEERDTMLRRQRVWKPCLPETLKYELWLSLESVEYNFQTLWHHIAEHQPDLSSFESKMEARLQSLCLYHADLYQDNRFSAIGTTLIKNSKDVQKGSNVTPPQKALLLQFFKQYGWFLTPVLWNRAELLFLLVCVFDPRLLFVQVIQNDAKSQINKRQNRGIALCSNFLTGILLQRLVDFDLLNCSHPSGEAIVVDSNGSYVQHFQAQRTIDCFKAMSPLKVISVSKAPAALSCNGLYTQISEHLYAQNVAYPQNGDQPEPRIIQVTEGRWCFKLLLAYGVDCWLMRQADSDVRQHPEDVQRWHALTGCGDDSACSVGVTEENSLFEFDFGSGGGYVRIEHDPQDFVHSTDADFEIFSETSFLPAVGSPMSVFDGPLCALFCLMFGTSLGLSDCSMQIPIGACIMSDFLVPHRDPFCFINRRALQLSILNQDFSKIPAQNLECRFRVLACSKQRQAHGRVDFYDLSLLHNISTFDISPGIRLGPLERSHVVFRNDWVYTGDVNLDNEPNGFGSMCFRSTQEGIQCGFFKDGHFIRACESADSAVVATRHINTLFMLLQFLACGSNASLVVADDTVVKKTFEASLDALQQCLHHVSFTVLQNLYDALQSLPSSSRGFNSLISTAQSVLQRLATTKKTLSGCSRSNIGRVDDYDEAADTADFGASDALQHIHTGNAVGGSTVALGDETCGSDIMFIDNNPLSVTQHNLRPSIIVHSPFEPNLSSSQQEEPSADSPLHFLKRFILKQYASKYFSNDDLSKHSELGPKQDLMSAVQSLLDERFLCRHPRQEGVLCISPDRRQWSDFTLIFPDQSCESVHHKDCGIWLDSAFGLPSDIEPLPFKCFSIHVALSYSKISGRHVSPWELETYMQYRFQQFCTAINSIQGSARATQLMTQKFQAANALHNFTEIGPDHVANSAFWLNPERLEDLASSRGSGSSYVCMWAFLFLPLEFLQYNYLVINTRPQSDNTASAVVVGGCYHFISENHEADTITLRFEGAESGHFSSLSFLSRKQYDTVSTKIVSVVNTTQIKFKKVRTELWDAIADIFVDVSIENFISKPRPQFQLFIPETDFLIISDELQHLGGSECSPDLDVENPDALLCEKEELVKEAVDIMQKISALNKNSFLLERGRRGKAVVDFQMGSTCLDNLTVVVDKMYQRYSESFACAALSQRVAEACYHLQRVVDELDRSVSKKQFLRRCESFARRFDKPKFWTDQAADSNCIWNQQYCDELLLLRNHQRIPDYACKPYPESYQKAVDTPVNISTCRVPFLNPFTMLMNDACIDWFFMALTVLFPAYAYLPCTVCAFRQNLSEAQLRSFAIWLGNFKSRRSTAVLLPVNLPSDLGNCISSTNPGVHWVLITMGCEWDRRNSAGWHLSQVEVVCMDPVDKESYKAAALHWFEQDLLPLFNSSHASYPKASSAKLQCGSDQFHCGAFVMSLGLNFVMGTLKSMSQHLLLTGKKDSSLVGLDLRKMAVWDSVQDPPLLDACLFMCPSFKHVRNVEFTYHSWWKCTPHYDLRKCLNVELESSGTFLLSGFSQGMKKGRFFQQEKEGRNSGFCFGYPSICVENHVATDGPFFYSNDKYFVKVYCIGLFGHFHKDRASVSRARRAFHDASATSYFCEKNQWSYKSFGLICFGLATPCCFVCIARDTLKAANLTNQSIGSLCVTVTKTTKSMHGDVYLSNVLQNPKTDVFEFVDCERAFRLSSEGPSAWFYSWYASSVASQKQLEIGIIMDKLKKSGLQGTSCFFSNIYHAGEFLNIAFDSKLFEQCPEFQWTYDSFLHLMELLSCYDPVISGTILNVSVTVKIGRFDYTINVERLANGSVIIVVTSSSQQDSCIESKRTLESVSDTTFFFNALVNASKCSEDVAKSDAVHDTGPDIASSAESNGVPLVASNGVGGAFKRNPVAIPADKCSRQRVSPLVPFGLPNIGNTCYMNACLQCLLHTTELSHLFLSSDFDGSSLQSQTNCDANTISHNRNVASCFKKIVNYSSTDNLDSMLLELLAFVQRGLAKRDTKYCQGGVADATECFFHLVECICPSMFRSPMESQVFCEACESTFSVTVEDFVFMPFPPPPRPGVATTFDVCLNVYLSEERLASSNQYNCGNCRSLQDAQKQVFLKDLPDFFFIGLVRFQKLQVKNTGVRINRNLDIPLEYDFGRHYRAVRQDSFRLYAAVCHVPGGIGHYVAYCLNPEPNPDSSWSFCNDSSVVQCSEQEMLPHLRKNGYFFFFRRCTTAHPVLATNSKSVTNVVSPIVVLVSSAPSSPVLVSRTESCLTGLPATLSSCIIFTGLVSLSSLHVDSLIGYRNQFDASIPCYIPRFKTPESLSAGFDEVSNHAGCRTPFVNHPEMFISDDCVDWFFMALTALFPAYMLMPCTLFHFRVGTGVFSKKYDAMRETWKANFFQRRPLAVLLPVNFPCDISRERSETNAPIHWGLFAIQCEWKHRSLDLASISCMESFGDKNYAEGSKDWIYSVIIPILKPKTSKWVETKLPTLQRKNLHCGVYCMALGLNYVMGTLATMHSRLLPRSNAQDTSDVGLELRKMAAWDSVQDPPLLDACLCMCPSFNPLSSFKVTCNDWWCCIPYYDLRKSLNVVLRSKFEFKISGWSHGSRFIEDGSFQFDLASLCNKGKVAIDGPFFFSNDEYFVKVHCIGLLGHFQKDRISTNRAAKAFQEAAASSLVCHEHDWWCHSFGLVCMGLSNPCVFVCIARSKLICSGPTVDVKVGCEVFFKLAKTPKKAVLHGDPHPHNMGAILIGKVQQLQAHDLERTFYVDLGKASLRQIEIFTKLYYTSLNTVLMEKLLMPQVVASGLDATNLHFSTIYVNNDFMSMRFDADAFRQSPVTPWRYCAWLHLMELLIESELSFNQAVQRFVINFRLEAPSRIGNEDAYLVDCELQFSVNDDQVLINSCAQKSVDPASDDGLQFQDLFGVHPVCLTDEHGTLHFSALVNNMLLPRIGSRSDGCSSSDEDNAPQRAPLQNSRNSDPRPSSPKPSVEAVDGRKRQKTKASQAPAKVGWPVWLYEDLEKNCGNQHVVESIQESMKRRFQHAGSLEHLTLVRKSEPLNVFRPEHFGCEVVLVANEEDRQACLSFIHRTSHLSFDTESTVPDAKGICLIQIGTTTNVFIIQVTNQSSSFLTSFEHELNATKTLICWGDDERALKAVLPKIMCKFEDLQTSFSTHHQKIGLDKCVEDLFQKKYVLSKTWRLSGWDNPKLTQEQIRYASLDVVACHALFLSKEHSISVHESSDVHITFYYATDLSTTSCKVRHGFCFSPNFLGHYKDDVVYRGFDFGSSEQLPPRLTGFRALEDISHGVMQVDVNAFLQLLNDYKFCCSLCSGCWFLKECRFFVQQSRDSFSYIKNQKSSVLSSSVKKLSTNTNEHDAFFCLSMLAIFLRMSPSEDHLQSLKKSVCSDIHYGYIRETLAHLT